jgi:cell division protein DivIC
MKNLNKILHFFKNKYILVIVAFVVWMLFFDDKNVGFMYSSNQRLSKLKESQKNIETNIKSTKKELSLLTNSASSVEKYARENFFMKKDNEELFITDIK